MSLPTGIRVDFGWEFDGIRSTQPALSQVTVGPSGLISLLATRLGLEGQIDQPTTRIAQYRTALEEHSKTSPDAWYRASFDLNPWSVARNMLTLRDFLARYGWTAQEIAPATYSRRLKALNDVEFLLGKQAGWLNHSSNSAGAVTIMLESFVTGGTKWPLGIAEVHLHHCAQTDLPDIYQRIFRALTSLGISVKEVQTDQSLEKFSILCAETEWEAATAAARILAGRTEQKTAVLAGASTEVLDRELNRRGLPQLGVRHLAARDVVSIFLSAMAKPHDVQAILALLQLTFPSADRKALRFLIPNAVRRVFIDALSQEPGVGGTAWQKAVTAFDTAPEQETKEQEKTRLAHQDIAHLLDSMIAQEPLDLNPSNNPLVDKELLDERLKWLRKKLNNLAVNLKEDTASPMIASELRAASEQVETVRDVLENMDSVRVRELLSLVASTVRGEDLKITGQRRARICFWLLARQPLMLLLIRSSGGHRFLKRLILTIRWFLRKFRLFVSQGRRCPMPMSCLL